MTCQPQKRSGLLAALAVALGSVLAGCFSPDLADAECVACPDNVCPGSLVCSAGHCVNPDSQVHCPAQKAVGAAGAGPDSTAAMPTESGGGPGTGDGAPGGAGGSPEDGPALTAELPAVACTDHALSVSLAVRGGRAPYSWRLEAGADYVALSTADDKASLRGTFDSAGRYTATVSVTDADQRSAERKLTLDVHETPVIRTEDLPSACPDELYSAKLEADGGDSSTYVWSAALSGDLGLTANGDGLTGRIPSDPDGPTSVDVTLGLVSDGCSAKPVTLPLRVEGSGATVCPRILTDNGDPVLPAACAGSKYWGGLTVVHGSPGYQWSALSVPDGLSFNPDTQKLEGVGGVAGTLSVAVQDGDGRGRTIAADFAIGVRDKCWLAYLASKGDVPKLNLFDPLQPKNDPTLPQGSDTDRVLDFAFSPDGRFITYRIGPSSEGAHLTLVELSTFRAQSFNFDAVTHYVWSNDSQTLAVAFSDGTSKFLGGVDVSRAGGSSKNGLDYPTLRASSANVASPLVWFAGGYVAFLEEFDVDDLELWTTARTEEGFADGLLRFQESFDSAAHLRAATDGVYAVPGNGGFIEHFPADGSPPSIHDAVVPSGRFVAGQDGHDLLIFRATDNSALPETNPRDTSPGCDAVLGWASGRDRVACAVASDNQPIELRVFDVAAKGEISAPLVVGGDYQVPEVPLGRQRLFAPSGAYLAFTTSDALYVARVAPGATIVDRKVAFLQAPGADDAVLAFSPSETLLLEHRGTVLTLVDVEHPGTLEAQLSSALPESEACHEDPSADHGTYCGDLPSNRAFGWSADSTLVAFVTDTGALAVKDLRFKDYGVFGEITVAEPCADPCALGEAFSFQP